MPSILRTSEGYRILKLITREPAGQRDLADPKVQQTIRETLINRKDQLLKAAEVTGDITGTLDNMLKMTNEDFEISKTKARAGLSQMGCLVLLIATGMVAGMYGDPAKGDLVLVLAVTVGIVNPSS